MTNSVVYSGNEQQYLYTTRMKNDLSVLPIAASPFPGFWQSYIAKAREWRITVVGDKTFDVAIYTDSGAKDDWRCHQRQPTVQFKQETFPGPQKEMCIAYLDALGLRFGAFDFIETPDGEIVFLECNPNGQYGWLEKEIGFPISDAITNELVDITCS